MGGQGGHGHLKADTSRRTLAGQYALMGGMLVVLACVLIYPVWLTVQGGFREDIATHSGWTLDHVELVFRDPVLRGSLLNSAKLAATVTVLTALIGLPLAFFSARCDFPGKALWNAAVLCPLILPPFVGAIGLRAILGREGALNALLGTEWDALGEGRFWGVALALGLNLYPILYLNASAALANLDPALDEAAQTSGAGPWKRFFSVTLPLIRPGLFAGGTVVFIWSFTELGTPLMFEWHSVASVQIFNGVKDMNASAQPYALTAVMLAAAVIIYAGSRLTVGRQGHAMQTRASRAAQANVASGWRGWAISGAFGLVMLLALLPHAGVIVTSVAAPGSWYQTVLPTRWTAENFGQALSHPVAAGAITNSLKLSAIAVVVNVVIGVAAAYLIERTRLRGRLALDALVMLPLAVPGLVMAFGYVAMTLSWPFGKGDPLEGALDVLGSNPNPFPLLIVAYAVRRLPYIVRSASAGLQQITPDLEQAAANLGAGTLTTVRRVIVPLITANLIAGGLLVFAFSMLEVSDSLILAQQERHYPITKAIMSFTERLGDGNAIACGMGVWGMLLLATTLTGASLILGKKLGALFRA